MRLSSLVIGRGQPLRAAALALGLSLLVSGVSAQDRTTESGEATITDPNAECTPYYDPLTASLKNNYPTIWEIAGILPNDTVALNLWNTMSALVPNISVKGDPEGNFTNTTPYYSPTDPDCWWTYSHCTTPKISGLPPDIIATPEPNTFGVGFDDGPNCSHNLFYDYLYENNQKATMYYIGSNVFDWPSEAQRGVSDGHQIAVHTWSHRYMTALTSDEVFAELYYSMQALKQIVGVTPRYWRPPYGDVDDRVRWIAHQLGLQTVIWSADSNDWREGVDGVTSAQVDANYESLISNATSGMYNTGGTIMLTHELNNYTMGEFMSFYPQLKQAFKYLMPIAVALNDTNPYQETNITFPTFTQWAATYPPNGTTVDNANGTITGNSTSSSGTSAPSGSSGSKQSSGALRVEGAAAVVAVLAAAAGAMLAGGL